MNDQRRQNESKWYDDCAPDCTPDCPDCGGLDCAPDCGFSMVPLLSMIALAGPGRAPRKRPTVPGRAGMAAIRGYQKWISHRIGARCRHEPSCSAYGMTAVRRYGLVTGSRLTADRLRRCTAPTPHGTKDPVP